MLLIFRLPFILAETALRQGLAALEALLRLVRGGEAEDDRFAAAAPEPRVRYAGDRPAAVAPRPAAAPGPPPPTAEEAIARRRAREAANRPPPPARPAPEPRRPPATGPHVDREAEVVESLGPAEGPHATLQVEAPWDGYDAMAANAVIERIRGADEATKAVVRLYEQMHKKRRTVLAATER
jgi:hypothetical protein